tara:strand:+ start:3149 stop:3649 length:501 start_codon:yes stop_codon:yes gene_type:complete
MRRFHFLLFFTFACYVTAFSQENKSITASINVSAEVIQSIELITVNSLRFGDLQPGQKELYINPINDINAGYMIALGTPGASFRITYLLEQQLTHSEGKGGITFSYEISANTEENQPTSELLKQNNRNIEFNLDGRYYFWIGGRLNLENAQPGNYQGDFTIEIDYI